MGTACLFIGWGRPVPGREQEAFAFLMGEALERLDAWRTAGWFERFEAVGVTPHGGDLGGFILPIGERAKLDELRRTDDFEAFSMKANRLFFGYGVVPGVTREGMKGVAERNRDVLSR